MPHIHAINCIEVPHGYEQCAIDVRAVYIDYLKKQTGYISSIFYRASVHRSHINFINIVVWESQEAYDAVVNAGYGNSDGENEDGMKILGKGFPDPIKVHPGVYEIIGN